MLTLGMVQRAVHRAVCQMVFQILNNKWKRQRAVQCQYDSGITPTVLEMATPFRTTTPSVPEMTAMSAKQANPVHVNALPVKNTS